MSARAEVRQAVSNAISSGVTDVSGRVFSRRRNALRTDELPCVAVQANDATVETITNEGPGSRIQQRTITATVSACVSASSVTADDDADMLAAKCQACLADFSMLIPGKIIEGQLVGEHSTDAEIEGGFVVIAVMTYQYVVQTNEANPDQLL